MSKPMSKQMQKLADRYEKATGKKFDVKTNAQKIRGMSDEELLGCLLELQDMAIKRFANFEPPDYQWMADWLQQPAEEDDHE